MAEPAEVSTPTPEVAHLPPAKPAPTANFSERWKAHTGEDVDAAAAVEKQTAPAKKPAAVIDAVDVDGTAGPLPSERAEFREWKRGQREKLQAEYDAKMREVEEERGKHAPDLTLAQKVKAAKESGDPDGLAQALGYETFNAMQKELIQRLADPNYKELRRIREELENEKKEKATAAEQAEQQQTARQQREAQVAYINDLSAGCKASSEPLVREMAEDPMFLNAIYRIQKEHWDGFKTLSIEQAIKKAARGAQRPLADELQGLYERLHRALGPKVAERVVAAVAVKGTAAEKGPKSAPIPPSGTGEPATPVDKHDPVAWRKYTIAKMNEADD